jgi:YD repeat-containing protein
MKPATKLLDPVLGLDFHLVHPPGGAPVLVPHPRVGVSFDPLDLLPVPETIAPAQRGGGASAGTLALPSGRRWKALSKRAQRFADKLGERLKLGDVARNRVHRTACTLTAHAIDVATGKVFSDFIDLALPGPLPLELERVWYSTSAYVGPLGRGWHHGYDAALFVTPALSLLRTPDGRAIAFPPLEPGEAYWDQTERLTLVRDEPPFAPPYAGLDALYRLETAAGLIYRFGPLPARDDTHVNARRSEEPERHVLLDVEGAGRRNALRYDDAGRLREIHDSAGRALSFVLDDQSRITALEAPHPEYPGHRFRAASYVYDERGNLAAVTDAHGYALRYAYTGSLLVKQTDRAGRELYFQWNGADESARCVRVWSAGGTYAQELSYEPHVTRVLDALGHTTLYRHDGERVLPAGA